MSVCDSSTSYHEATVSVTFIRVVFVGMWLAARRSRSRESPTADGWRHSAGCYRYTSVVSADEKRCFYKLILSLEGNLVPVTIQHTENN